jgi:hypothetical protein
MENKFTRLEFQTTSSEEEKNFQKGVMKLQSHKISVDEGLLSRIQDAIHQLEMEGYHRNHLRITAPPITVRLIQQAIHTIDHWQSTHTPVGQLFGVQCNFEHPYMEIVIHHTESAMYPNLLVKINLNYDYTE